MTVGAEIKEVAWKVFHKLTRLLQELNVETSQDKIVPPTMRLEFLGITFDSNRMTMELSEEKLVKIQQELNTWLYKTSTIRKEVESLIVKLQFAAKCVKAGRIFLGRLIAWIRGMDRKKTHTNLQEARKDIAWWGRFMAHYNGISHLMVNKGTWHRCCHAN